jgi:hypothetical protein
MLRMLVVCLAAVLVWAGSALAAPQLVQNENGDAALLFDILAQRRPAQATSSTPGGAFGPLTALTPTAVPHGVFQHQNVAIDDHGGAVATWTGFNPSGGCPCATYVSVKPPGGEFGPPQQLSEAGQDAGAPQVDVNPRGDAIVAWSQSPPHALDGVLTYSTRPAGGSFSAPATVPGPITQDITAVLEAGGGVLFLGNEPSSGGGLSKSHAVYRRPDGTFEQPVALDPVPDIRSAGIAANRRGDVLIAWAANGTVRARERPAGGTFGEPEIVATGNEIPNGDTRAVINDAGDAAITFGPWWLVTRSHGGPFGPRQLRPPMADTLAMNERGDLALAWVQPARSVMAAYRPAGGAFGLPMLLGVAPFIIHGGQEPPLSPALSIDGAGTATAVWEDSDGETVGVRARHFAAGGPGSAATAATLPAYVQEAPPEACVPAGYSVLARSGRAVVVGNSSSQLQIGGCLLARGVLLDVAFPRFTGGGFTDVQLPLRVAVAGPFVATVVRSSYHGGISATGISILDLRDEWSGQSRSGPALTGANTGPVPVLRSKRDGSAAWIACPPGKKGARGACRLGSKRIKQVYAFGLSRDTPKLVGEGAKIDPASLKIGTDRVRWRDAGHRRSAPLG